MQEADVLRKVRLLLDKADSTTFEAEADTFRAKADELMTRYAIESWQVDQARGESNRQEVPTTAEFFICYADNPVKDHLMNLLWAVCAHTRCRSVVFGARDKTHREVTVKLVGFPTDVKYCEWLFTSLWIQMQRDLEPKPNPDQSFEDNVVMMLESGLSRVRIAELMGLPRHPTIGRMSKIYRDWCKENGKEYVGRGTRPMPITYARNFAQGYVQRVGYRLAAMKAATERAVGGDAIVLFDKSSVVTDYYKQLFPATKMYRAQTKAAFNAHARKRGDEAGARADIGQPRVGGDRKAIEG